MLSDEQVIKAMDAVPVLDAPARGIIVELLVDRSELQQLMADENKAHDEVIDIHNKTVEALEKALRWALENLEHDIESMGGKKWDSKREWLCTHCEVRWLEDEAEKHSPDCMLAEARRLLSSEEGT